MKDILSHFASILFIYALYLRICQDRYLLIFRTYHGYRGQESSHSGLRPKRDIVHEQPSLH